MSRKNHIKSDGMLIRTDKQFRHLKNSQKEKISNWLYDEYKNAYDKIGKAPDSRRNEEIVSAVYEKSKIAVFGFLIMRLKSIIAVKRISIANGMIM